ncbi:hypothetical protein CDCA_CDCA12G3543 [Cyanidium caldarium]|uniref:Sugar phosphate transporter domain-containing protein n=1 Tax=Cyanidium caldarium TaxID=2771 RepID=A0AAV9IZJ6_CYACA|nr:hypothetical protein CDCA_CDCA12G3543 [Cyanidium caldarium]
MTEHTEAVSMSCDCEEEGTHVRSRTSPERSPAAATANGTRGGPRDVQPGVLPSRWSSGNRFAAGMVQQARDALSKTLGRGRDCGAIGFNFLSSVGIVTLNKRVFLAGFSFATTLTCWHYVATTLGVYLLSLLGLFRVKRLDWRKCARLALGNLSFVVFSNLSLQYNSVAFYQLMKHLSTPVVIFIEVFFYHQKFEWALVRSLLVMVVGMIVTFATDFNLNVLGTLYALASVAASGCYAVWAGSLQRELDADPLQLQLYVAPMVAAMIAPLALFTDVWGAQSDANLLVYPFTVERARLLLSSGAVALCVNVSVFMVIGYTSSVTYCVVGIAKTGTIILADFLFFGRPLEWVNFCGILVALVGVVNYSFLKVKGAARAKNIDDRPAAVHSPGRKMPTATPNSV